MHHLKDAHNALVAGQVDAAALSFACALDDAPEHPVALAGLALCHLERGDMASAFATAERALRADGDNHAARTLLLRVLASEGDAKAVASLIAPLAGTPAADRLLADPLFATMRDHPLVLQTLDRL